MKTARYATLYFICLLGMNGAASAHPYTISTNGTEVTDLATGLIWRRCAEGLQGSACTGTASTYTHQEALLQAANVSSPTTVWRLPNIKELGSITDGVFHYGYNITIPFDPTAFPATPTSLFWSSSPDVINASNALYVDFGSGHIGSNPRSGSTYVRLVRAGQ